MKVIGAKVPVKGIPMVKEANVRKFQAIIEQSEKLVRVKVTTRSFGTPYAETAQGEECWDIFFPDKL